jgi:Rad3-related DNA helicase
MWSLFDDKGELKALKFSNGKTQENVVQEIVDNLNKGEKIIFIHGKCGTGKSAVALNVAKEIGKTSIVVPIKNLQRQYKEDYTGKKYVLKTNGQKLKITLMTGRKNHSCPYLTEISKEKETIKEIQKIQEQSSEEAEKNASLYDIFEGKEKKEEVKQEDGNGEENKRKKGIFEENCDNPIIPCKIELKEKNIELLKKYYNENPDKANLQNLSVKMLKRFSVAPACSYWSPIAPIYKEIDINAEEKIYDAVGGRHIIYKRRDGCPYYKQFLSYLNDGADVIMFNSDLYLLETALGRKPATNVEIIDECDEFLDNLSVEGMINLNRLKKEIAMLNPKSEVNRVLRRIIEKDIDFIIDQAKRQLDSDDIMPMKNTRYEELIKTLANNDFLYEDVDEDSYLLHCFEVADEFCGLINDTYIGFSKDKKGDIYLKLVTINLDKRLNSIIKKNKAFVFMSGTLHSERVLKEIFGLKEFKVIDAETFNPGTITKVRTELEKEFSFDNFSKGKVTREEYLKALNKCLEIAKPPVVVHVNAFQDLPSYDEKQVFNLGNLITSSELIESQKADKEGKLVEDFKKGKTKVLFTTRCNRGIDFPFDVCNSVVITKFPYPNIQGLFWKILKKNKPAFFWNFYKDKAHRELLQRVYRSVRASDDHVFLLSPDLRVLESKVI